MTSALCWLTFLLYAAVNVDERTVFQPDDYGTYEYDARYRNMHYLHDNDASRPLLQWTNHQVRRRLTQTSAHTTGWLIKPHVR